MEGMNSTDIKEGLYLSIHRAERAICVYGVY